MTHGLSSQILWGEGNQTYWVLYLQRCQNEETLNWLGRRVTQYESHNYKPVPSLLASCRHAISFPWRVLEMGMHTSHFHLFPVQNRSVKALCWEPVGPKAETVCDEQRQTSLSEAVDDWFFSLLLHNGKINSTFLKPLSFSYLFILFFLFNSSNCNLLKENR